MHACICTTGGLSLPINARFELGAVETRYYNACASVSRLALDGANRNTDNRAALRHSLPSLSSSFPPSLHSFTHSLYQHSASPTYTYARAHPHPHEHAHSCAVLLSSLCCELTISSTRMYVLVHTRMYVLVHTCTYVCTYVCLYVCMYVCTYVCMYVRTYVCTYVCTYATCMHDT